MSGAAFNWKDMNRIAKKTFTDTPKDYDELRAWTSALLLICTSAPHILRTANLLIESEGNIFSAVYQSLKDSIAELTRAAGLFPRYQIEKFIDEMLATLYETTGYVAILERR